MAISTDDQQFCLRWNNFQANITSQFETLRDDQDFTDVTIACEGQRLQAHKVVLSACSPFFKELFKSNPCSHPIIFMRDVEVRHIVALMEFMYAGEVNVAQAHLPAFLKTAESLKIRGLTETTTPDPEQSRRAKKSSLITSSSSSTVTSSQDIADGLVSPPAKRQCKSESDRTTINLNSFELQTDNKNQLELDPKVELPDYMSDDDDVDDNNKDENNISNFFVTTDVSEITAGIENVPQTSSSNFNLKETSQDGPIQGNDNRRLHSLDPRPCEECGRVYSNLSNLRQHMKLIHFPTFVQCHVCLKPFKTELYLRRHMINSHDGKNYNNPTDDNTKIDSDFVNNQSGKYDLRMK